MDGAWALYEAWVKLQLGEIDTALVYCYGKSSPGDLPMVLTRQLDPYYVGAALAGRGQPRRPPGPGAARRRQGHRGSRWPRSPPAAASRRMDNPYAQLAWDRSADELLDRADYLVDPLRKHDCPPITDGAAAVVLAAGDVARERGRAPGVDPRHRPPHRADGPRPARPHDVGRPPGWPRRRPAWPTARSTSPSCTPRSPTRS